MIVKKDCVIYDIDDFIEMLEILPELWGFVLSLDNPQKENE